MSTVSAELDVLDAEVVDSAVVALDEGAARRLDTSIRLTVGTIRSNFDKLQEKVYQAKSGEAWKVLGFASWTAYLADLMGEQPLMLQRAERQELTEFLHSEGMSNRAIAQAANTSEATVRNDLRSASSPVAEPSATAQSCAVEPDTTIGLNAKTYTRPTPVPDPPKVEPATTSAANPPKPVPHAKFLRNLGSATVAPVALVLADVTVLDDSITPEVGIELFDVYAKLSTELERVMRLLLGLPNA